jgi:predicted helicase
LSQLLIQRYLNELQTLRRISGTSRESVVREAFKTLLKDWGRSRDLIFVAEYEYQTPQKTRVYPDGALLHALRVPLGYWEAKDEEDDLDKEIEKKFRKGYPQDNILFEDSHQACLIQNKQTVMRCAVDEPTHLHTLLELFFGYEREEIADFRKAVTKFKSDLPEVLKALRKMIETAEEDNDKFRKAALRFLKHAKDTINTSVTAADVREMLIQHILTEEIFSQVFDDSNFHRQNNVAKELYALENTFFTGKVKHDTLAGLRLYYAAIKSAAALVSSHHEKQNFLKTIYESFYKVYNKKAADRLGVVYTPSEIVRFMVEGTDWLCQRHFGKALVDKNVEILDPAVGTGTFITELIEHFRGQPTKLRYKYLEELHANEVAILPYYVANLNIEATFATINGYEEYPNLCFVDTLDNVAALGIFSGYQHDLFGGVSEVNIERIKRQNEKKISVIIGNPPYNAWQENYNSRNPNRPYRRVDDRIRDTYAKQGTAKNQNSLYDMYTRFFRWASDRIGGDGIIAFITNRNYIEKNAFDGFRRIVARDFKEIWLVDLGGDVRANPKLSGTKQNVFGIQTGVAISFFIKKRGKGDALIYYARRPEMESRDDKLSFIGGNSLETISFDTVRPDKKGNWINQTDNDWDSLVPVADRKSKTWTSQSQDRAIFRLVSNGLKTQRDEWVYDIDRTTLVAKAKYLVDMYESVRLNRKNTIRDNIKWDRELERYCARGISKRFDDKAIVRAAYRPFSARWLYFDQHFNGMTYQQPSMFPASGFPNEIISFSDTGWRADFCVFAADGPVDLHFGASVDAYQVVSRYRYGSDGSRADNITDWALELFRAHYEKGMKGKRSITKDAIFKYVYGVLYDPLYREKYGMNLKREFPRVPLYADFWRWADWGESLMTLHVGYEMVEPWPLERVDVPDERSRKAGLALKAMLRADKDAGNIQLDTETQLTGVPLEAWSYRLGNRSALEWVLDQYKESKPKDPTIREKFNTYRFADHKEKVVALLKRVTRVSVDTMKIVEAMRAEKRLKRR